MKEILKIICDWSKDVEKILIAAGDNNLDHSSGWYLHGDLEDLCGYDLATIYNMSDLPESCRREVIKYNLMIDEKTEVSKFDTYKKSYLHGVWPVEVYGVQEECIGYFWVTEERECVASLKSTGEERKFKNWMQRGLVCLKSDTEAIEYAKRKYTKNSCNL